MKVWKTSAHWDAVLLTRSFSCCCCCCIFPLRRRKKLQYKKLQTYIFFKNYLIQFGLHLLCFKVMHFSFKFIVIKDLSPGQTDSQVDASHRRFSTCTQLAFCLAIHLLWLALILVELKRVRKLTQHLHRFDHPTHVNCICVKFMTCVNLWADLRVRLAVHTQVLVLKTCGDLRVRLARALNELFPVFLISLGLDVVLLWNIFYAETLPKQILLLLSLLARLYNMVRICTQVLRTYSAGNHLDEVTYQSIK